MNGFRRMWAFLLSAAMIVTSSSVGSINVYAAEDDIILAEESSAVELADNGEVTGNTAPDALVEDVNDSLADEESDKLTDGKDVLEDDELSNPAASVKESSDSENTGDDVTLVEDRKETDDEEEVTANETAETYNEGEVQQIVQVGDLKYLVDTQFAIVVGWNPKNPEALMDVTVPSNIELDKETYVTPLIEGETYKREVIGIAAEAFSEPADQEYKLRSVTLGDSVKQIGERAFIGCTALTSIKFPKEMVSTSPVYGDGLIGGNAFNDCTALATVTLPDKLDSVGGSIFAGCTSLTSVEIPSGWGTTKLMNGDKEYSNVAENTVVTGPFAGCDSLATVTFAEGTSHIALGMLAQCNSIKSIEIPATVTDIGDKAFYKDENLEEVRFSSGSKLVSVGKYGFQLCKSLKAANLPKYTKTVGEMAFVDCSSLTETTIPFSIGEVGAKAYFRCVDLATVTFGEGDPNNITGGKIGAYAFGGENYNATTKTYKSQLSKIKTLTFPNSITMIGNNAFDGCDGLTTLTFEDKFDSFTEEITIGEKAFYNCTSLVDVVYSENLAVISASAFENNSSIKSLRLPNSVREVGNAAFKDTASLNSLKLSERLKTLGEQAFKGTPNLRQVEIPMSLEKVGPAINDGKVDAKVADKGVFSDSGLTEVTFKRFNKTDDKYRIPDHILLAATMVQKINMPEGETTEIGEFAFSYCLLLNKVTIPESCNFIGGGAFAQCEMVKTLTIPSKVTSIGRSAFIYCSSLESIELPASLETLGEGKGYGAFESCTSLKQIVLPDTVTTIGEATFKNCQNLETATLPAGVTKIDNELFYGCLKLAEVKNVSKDTLTEIGNSAFEKCPVLASFDNSGAINFSEYEKLNKIGDKAFYGCDGVTAVKLSAATATLGESVFDSCKNLSELTLATGSKTIPVNAFANDPGLREVIIPRTVETIKTGAFSRDINLEKVHISKDTELEDGVFSYCDHLTIYGFDPSPAKTYADKNKIPFVHEDVYATSIKFTDKSEIRLDLKKDKNKDIPGIDIKPVNYTVDVKCTSDNEGIFTVDEYTDTKTKETKYVLNPKGVGTATLTALVQSDASGKMISDSVSVTVKKAVESVSMASGMKKDNTLNIPDTLQLAVVVKPDDATDKTVKWVSGDRSICDVDSEGVVYSKGVGETTVAAISNDDETKMFVFNVKVTDSHVKKADPSWPNNIQKPRIVGVSGTTVSGTYGAEIALACDTPGAQIYFTVDNSEPLADYEGNMDGATRHYTAPIVLNEATFGKEAIESGTLHINAKSIREGFQYSTPVNFVVNLEEGSEWGDIDPTARMELFNGVLENVPKTIWFAFKGDDTPYTKGAITKVKKEYADGEAVTFNEDIRVFYGTSLLYEGRDYGVKYASNTAIANADSSNAPSVIIKGKGGIYKGSETFSFSIIPKGQPTGKITADEIEVTGLNTTPVYTGKPLTLSEGELGKVTLSYKGTMLLRGTDYEVVSSSLRASGKFKVEFQLIGDKYEGTVSRQVNVMPYDLSKDKEGGKKIAVKLNGGKTTIPYCKTGAKPDVAVTLNGVLLKEGLDYTLKYKNNKKVSTGNTKASVIIRGKGNLKGKYVCEFTIAKQDLENVDLVAEDKVVKSQTSMASLKVLPQLMDNGKALSKLWDYDRFKISDCKYSYASGAKDGQTVEDSDPVPESGTLIRVEVSITPKSSGPYKVTQKTLAAYYRIISKDLKKAKVNVDKEFVYNEGKDVQVSKDDFTVTLNGEAVPASDYDIVSVKNNRLIGSATVQIKGKGSYGGFKSFTIKIKARKM